VRCMEFEVMEWTGKYLTKIAGREEWLRISFMLEY